MPVSFRSPIPAPPRPDHPAEPLRDYVRGSYQRGALTLLGFMLGGFLVGYATMAAHVPWGFTGSPSGMSSVSFTVAGIYLHNLLVVCVPILLFPLLFWAPGATAGLTGYSLGRLAAAWLGLHLPGSLLLAALVPHGIVEIPASLLGGLMAWRLGIAFWRPRTFDEPHRQRRVTTAVRAAAPVVVLVVIALGVAAFIEVKITPALVAHLAGF